MRRVLKRVRHRSRARPRETKVSSSDVNACPRSLKEVVVLLARIDEMIG
jgi:hypothetical protein